jgi:FkbM family methyltransferase
MPVPDRHGKFTLAAYAGLDPTIGFAMQTRTVKLDFQGREIPFVFPDSGNMVDHLREIMSGRTYPIAMLPPGYRIEVIVDAGANVGASAVWFLNAAPDARVVCFEPTAQNHRCLAANLASFPRAEVYHCGLFSRERTAELFLGRNQCMQNSLVASVEVGGDSETIALKRASTEFDRLGLQRISILKIDTEGCEVPILEDLGERLAMVDQIYVEYHSEEDRRAIDALLADRFSLAFCCAQLVHRGVALYVANDLVDRVPGIAAMRLPRPLQ